MCYTINNNKNPKVIKRIKIKKTKIVLTCYQVKPMYACVCFTQVSYLKCFKLN